ncbi:unnamed protein product, partial [Mesorhabditis belari]|uniref:ERCC4 domain-containing protein n=1 Tax=Mesorhabditis belari TaxID=2138241 RepID=A0AAF3EXW5_9BILA
MLKLGEYEKFPIYVVNSSGSDRYNTIRALQNVKPVVIIMYNTDLAVLRQVELYHALNSEYCLYFYLLQYAESTEEERYLSLLSRENEAFSNLRNEVENLLVSREYDTIREEAPRLSVSTLNAGGFEEGTLPPPKIIVDMREFNSELPTILYKKGYDVVAATLEVGDYVLSPGMTVERKALDDLTQSLQSGRVFKQTEQMLRHYGSAFLLIESNMRFELKIVNGGPFQLNASDPDVEKAIALRGDDVNEDDDQTNRNNGKLNTTLLHHLSEKLPKFNKTLAQKLMISDTPEKKSEREQKDFATNNPRMFIPSVPLR